jgi:hypothetical protein
MGVKVLPAELVSERAWQVYCLINPAAQKRIGLKADLDRYLSKLETVGSKTLTVDGLKYLESLEQLEGERFRTAPLATLGT